MEPLYQLQHYGLNDWLLSFRGANCARSISALHHQLRQHADILETVIGYDSLLIRTKRTITENPLRHLIEHSLETAERSQENARHHVVHVRYDGLDLAEIAEQLDCPPAEIISLHSNPLYTVRFLGFSPGFAYLDGLDPRLHLPRRSTPRPRMEAGAVAIGAAHAGIYSIPSPGGWNWLGNTDHPLFDKNGSDASAFTLHPGDTLRFHPIKA